MSKIQSTKVEITHIKAISAQLQSTKTQAQIMVLQQARFRHDSVKISFQFNRWKEQCNDWAHKMKYYYNLQDAVHHSHLFAFYLWKKPLTDLPFLFP